jgi:hypothetical protein
LVVGSNPTRLASDPDPHPFVAPLDAEPIPMYPYSISPQGQELWVPAEELDEFNQNIVGPIEAVVTFHGSADAEPIEIDPSINEGASGGAPS